MNRADRNNIQKDLRGDQRDLDRQIAHNEMEIKQSKKKLETMIKKGEPKAMIRPYAKNVLNLEKTHERLLTNKNKFAGAGMQINNAFQNQQMMENMGKVNDVMSNATKMVDINKITKTAQDMQTNLGKMDVMDELMGDAFGEMDDDDMNGDSTAADQLLDQVNNKMHAKKNAQGTKLVQHNAYDNEDDLDAKFNELMKNM